MRFACQHDRCDMFAGRSCTIPVRAKEQAIPGGEDTALFLLLKPDVELPRDLPDPTLPEERVVIKRGFVVLILVENLQAQTRIAAKIEVEQVQAVPSDEERSCQCVTVPDSDSLCASAQGHAVNGLSVSCGVEDTGRTTDATLDCCFTRSHNKPPATPATTAITPAYLYREDTPPGISYLLDT